MSLNIKPSIFKEFLYFKDKTEILDKLQLYKRDIENEFEIYLESQFIESIFIKDKFEKKEYICSIIKKIIFEDIPQIFSIENPELLWKIVKIIAQKPGSLVDYKELSKELGVSNKTISLYFYYLFRRIIFN